MNHLLALDGLLEGPSFDGFHWIILHVLFSSSSLLFSCSSSAVNKRRATPDFSWIDSYQIEAKETIDGDVETSLCSAVEECELVCDEGSPGQSRRVLKAEPNLNSLDSVSVHRIPIALGEPPNSSKDICFCPLTKDRCYLRRDT